MLSSKLPCQAAVLYFLDLLIVKNYIPLPFLRFISNFAQGQSIINRFLFRKNSDAEIWWETFPPNFINTDSFLIFLRFVSIFISSIF
jgi:hypothetical protein